MKEFKDAGLVAGFVTSRGIPSDRIDARSKSSNKQAPNEDLDLNLLADQLIQIAKDLRFADTTGAQREETVIAPEEQGDDLPLPGTSEMAPLGGEEPQRPPTQGERALYARTARKIYAQRRDRTAIFGDEELFGEPAWDILLDLYIADAEGKSISVSSACIGSASPPTTGLRWLGVLTHHELILREHDPEDQRRVLVRLTERGLAAMDQYFSRISPAV